MRHSLSVFAVLAAVWLLNSGHYGPLHLGLGALSVGFVMLLARRFDLVDEEAPPLYLTRRLFPYWAWLLKKILQSNLDVLRRIYSPDLRIDPQLQYVQASQKTDMGKVIFANSITLTPGTVSMTLDEGRILVHALSREGIEELHQGEMNRRVAELEQ